MSDNKFFARIDFNSIGNEKFKTSLYRLDTESNEWESVDWPEGKSLNEVTDDLINENNGKK